MVDKAQGQEFVEEAESKVAEGVEQVKAKAQESYDKAAEAVEEYAGQAADWIKDNPMTSVAIAFGAGALLSMLLCSRE